MRIRRAWVTFVAVLLLVALALADDVLHLALKSGAKLDGRVAASDDTGFTLKLSAGGEMRVLWKDLDVASWLAAKRAVVDPKDGKALLELARFAADNSLRADAEALAAAALKSDASLAPGVDGLKPRLEELRGAEAQVLLDRAKAHLDKHENYQALGRYQDALKLQPTNALAANGIGEAYYAMRRLADCRKYVEEAIRLDPACKDALLNRAMLDLVELDFKACLADLDQVIALPVAKGRFSTREEVLAAGKRAGIEKEGEAWKKFADEPLMAATQFRPTIQGIVDGPKFEKDFSVQTEHYDLHTDVSQDYASTIAGRMELIYAEYERRYSFERTGESKTRSRKLRFPVIVFKDREEYVKWFSRVLRNPALAAATGGVYVPMVKHLVFFQNKSFEDTQLVAWHEGFHQYLDYFMGDAPLWFNEGQAEYYGGSRLDKTGKKIVAGQTEPWRIGTLTNLMHGKGLPPAEWLMRCSRQDFMRLPGQKPPEGATGDGGAKWDAGDNYAASWALVHFCLEGEGKRWAPNLLHYFQALCDGQTPEEAFDRIWSRTNWTTFNAKFAAHCQWLLDRAQAEKDGKEPPPMPR